MYFSEFSSLGAFMDTITAKTSYLKPDFNQKEAKKPYCLIIESIDAASNEIISGLIGGLERPQSKKSKKQSMGLRPVILIGNLFAQSTRRLRPLCFSVHIAGLNRPRTIARLEKVSSRFKVPEPSRLHVLTYLDLRNRGFGHQTARYP